MSTATMSTADPIKPSSNKPQQQQQSRPGSNTNSLSSSTSSMLPSQHNTASSLAGTHKAPDTARRQTGSPIDGQNRKPPQQQPRAWQGGHNPITQRASSSTPPINGADKISTASASSQASAVKSVGDSTAERHAHDRALFLLAHMVGKDATITMKNGEKFTGVFSGGTFHQPSAHYTLKMAQRTRLPDDSQQNGRLPSPTGEYIGQGDDHVLAIDMQDTAELFVPDVNFANAGAASNGIVKSSFMTDTQISSKDQAHPAERTLQRWVADADPGVDMSLDSSGTTDWDQFAANQEKFGVSTDYEETIYTTAINRSGPEFLARQMAAERVAREIEGSKPSNAHVAEERRQNTWHEDGLGEEEKYSGVHRDVTPLPKRSDTAYVPPSRRPASQVPMPSATNVPTGAPLMDPAIISSQLKSNVPIANSTPAIPSIAHEQTTKDMGLAAPTAAASGDATSAQPVRVPKRSKEHTTEDHVRGTADAFKQFAHNEKARFRQAVESRNSKIRQEKDVKINDLKKFAENFKLKSRVPNDLVPILAKDPEKQREIQSKAEEAAIEEEQRKKDRESDKAVSVASPAAATASTNAAVAPSASGSSNDHRGQFPSQPRPRPIAQSRNSTAMAGTGHNNQRGHMHPQRGGPHNPASYYGRPPFQQPPQQDLRLPSGPPPYIPPGTPSDASHSPAAINRLNGNARPFELRPVASTFTPSGASPSPQRSIGSGVEPSRPRTPSVFFDKMKSKQESKQESSAPALFDTMQHIAEAEYDEHKKKSYALNGAFPRAYDTAPRWDTVKQNENVRIDYEKIFPAPRAAGQGTAPVPVPHMGGHAPPMHHQLPAGAVATTPQRPQFFASSSHGPAPGFDPRLPHFGPNGSVHNSPRTQHLHAAAFNGQMQPMPMPQYPGQQPQPPPQQQPQQQMPGFAMSPSIQYRQMQPPGGPIMMMPGQPHGQMAPVRPMYHQPGPQYPGGPQMGGHMMVQQPSGGYANGPMPQPGYSPMPPHAQPHMQHLPQHGGPVNYQGSPRPPPMMQHQGSHQGFNPQMHMQPQFAPSPVPSHPYHGQQQRAMSNQFPQMTPRQQHAVPQHASPNVANGPAPGDEGK